MSRCLHSYRCSPSNTGVFKMMKEEPCQPQPTKKGRRRRDAVVLWCGTGPLLALSQESYRGRGPALKSREFLETHFHPLEFGERPHSAEQVALEEFETMLGCSVPWGTAEAGCCFVFQDSAELGN